MVWALIPTDSVRGTQKYYIFLAGTYKVGRKDCDVIVQTDTSISRVHAEIMIDEMATWDPHTGTQAIPSHVRVVDRSKYGSFVNKESGVEGARLRKDEEAMLKDGDTVTFGTGNATFRLSFIPIVACLHGRKATRLDPSSQSIMTSVGASATRKWNDQCTHIIVDESSPLSAELIDAILEKKQIVSRGWFKVLAEQNIRTEFPSCDGYVPDLTLDGTEIKIMHFDSIEKCLTNYMFILGSSDKYKFGEKLHALLELAGAKFLHIDEFCSNSQTSGDRDTTEQILVIPARYPLEFNCLHELSSLPKVTDLKLIAAILSGRLEAAFIEPPAFIVTSSHSTDETIVADSDIEIDTATSDRIAVASKLQNDTAVEAKKETTSKAKEDTQNGEAEEDTGYFEEKNVGDLHTDSVRFEASKLNVEDIRVIDKKDKGDSSVADGDEACRIIFNHDLIVKNIGIQTSVRSENEVNFKRFRKREIVSGNSFNDLIPFAKEPYKESNYEQNKTSDFMREEKKRKHMEAIAEDLFNNSKAKKRAVGGSSIHTLLSGR